MFFLSYIFFFGGGGNTKKLALLLLYRTAVYPHRMPLDGHTINKPPPPKTKELGRSTFWYYIP